MHVNAQVRSQARQLLAPIPELTVSTNRGSNLDLDELPAAVVMTSTDRVEQTSKGPGALERRFIELTVTLVVEGELDELDDLLDEHRVQLEMAMASDPDEPMGGLAQRVEHTGGELDIARDEDGERWFGFLLLRWEVEVWTEQGNPEVAR